MRACVRVAARESGRGGTKIDNPDVIDVIRSLEEDVLRFEVSVNDISFMQVINRIAKFPDYRYGFCFIETT